jgi:hypothetical protein
LRTVPSQLVGVERRAYERPARHALEAQLLRTLAPLAEPVGMDVLDDRQEVRAYFP